MQELPDRVKAQLILIHCVFPIGFVLFAQEMLILFATFAKVLLVLGSGGEESYHDLLHYAGLAESFDAIGHEARLSSSALSNLRILLLSCQSFLIKERQSKERLCSQSLLRVMAFSASQEVLHLFANLSF